MTMDRFAQTNNIQPHYLDHAGNNPPLVLMPGLTNNAHSFDGLVHAGLHKALRVLAVDLRGRGLRDKPEARYSMTHHAADVLGLEQVVLGGYSFGGMVALYMAAKYPKRFSRLVIIDSALSWPSDTRHLLKASLNWPDRTFQSWEAYLELAKGMSFLDGYWDKNLENYYRADVEIRSDGTVKPRTPRKVIREVGAQSRKEDWPQILTQVSQPTLFLNVLGAYSPPPILPRENPLATAHAVANGRYVHVPGNHLTMVFGENGKRMLEEIATFVHAQHHSYYCSVGDIPKTS